MRSWLGGKRDGFPYDEATALVARLRRWEGPGDGGLEGVLRSRLGGGWLGRKGVGYVFDTALAMPWAPRPIALSTELIEALEAGIGSKPGEPERWSQRVGAHHLKVLPDLKEGGDVQALAKKLIDEYWTGERFRTEGDATYLHAHCYALEGLIGLDGFDDILLAGLDWLASVQDEDGSMPSWTNRPDEPRPNDTVAQAVRLWAAVDQERFGTAIAYGLDRLATQQAPDGGIRYSPKHRERNVWVTVFALQAAEWAREAPDAEQLANLV